MTIRYAGTLKAMRDSSGTGKSYADRFAQPVFDAFRRYGREIGLPIVVLALVLVFSISSDVFFTPQNLRNIGVAAAALAAVSFGQTFAVLTAGLDLSVGSTVALVSIVAAMGIRRHGIGLGVVEGVLAGTFVGLINGLVITRLGVFPFIATLAMLSILSGLALNLSGGIPVSGLPERFGNFAYEVILGIPAPFIAALIVLAVSHFTLRYTRFGRQIYAIGGNQEAARLSGIQINRVKVLAYVFCSFFAAIGSIVLTARVASGQPTLGVSLPLESVAAVVLGGVSLFGGRGSVIGVAFGVAFVSILSNGLNLLNVSSYTQMMVIGAALILAVAMDQLLVRRGSN
jgi:ribose transport system permease protein